MTDWLRECLTKPSSDKDSSPSYLDLSRAVKYRSDVGVNVQIIGASGLPGMCHMLSIKGVYKEKKFKSEIAMEVGGWVQVSLGILLLLENRPKIAVNQY